jgi:uncharacterized protein
MPISMYESTVPVLVRGLEIVARYMDKAAAHVADNKIDPSEIIQARLYPDMYPLAGQVQRCSDTSKGAVARLAGVEAPSYADTETTFDELKARALKTIDFLKSVGPEKFDGSEGRTIEMKFRTGPVHWDGKSYVLTFVLPNFFFHVTTLHDILRQNGFPVGKLDYLGSLGRS